MMNRRSLIRSLALAPVVLVASRFAFAQTPAPAPAAPAAGGLPALGEAEPLAKAMQYVADASKASAARTDKKANCENCAKFNICAPADKTCKPAAKTAAQAPCEIFAGKSVAKAGWCLSWTKKV
jgi:hypothetical protein